MLHRTTATFADFSSSKLSRDFDGSKQQWEEREKREENLENQKPQRLSTSTRLETAPRTTAEFRSTPTVSVQSAAVSKHEPFVDAQTVAAFLSINRAEVLRLTREGKIRGYAYKGYLRHVYRYRLSEVSEDFAAFAYQPKGTIAGAALVRQRRKSNG